MKAVRWMRWGLWWEGFLEKIDFESVMENGKGDGWWQWWWYRLTYHSTHNKSFQTRAFPTMVLTKRYHWARNHKTDRRCTLFQNYKPTCWAVP